MYLVGARFEELTGAEAVLAELRGHFALAENDVGLRPLGSLRYEAPTEGLVVAGRFQHEDVDDGVDILEIGRASCRERV